MLCGAQGSEKEVLNTYYMILNLFNITKRILKYLSLTRIDYWQLVTNNELEVELGQKNIIEHLYRFFKFYPNLQKIVKITEAKVNYIDLRYDVLGTAVQWTDSLVKDRHRNRLITCPR